MLWFTQDIIFTDQVDAMQFQSLSIGQLSSHNMAFRSIDFVKQLSSIKMVNMINNVVTNKLFPPLF